VHAELAELEVPPFSWITDPLGRRNLRCRINSAEAARKSAADVENLWTVCAQSHTTRMCNRVSCAVIGLG
jgi:hypothetical protein